MSIRILRNSVMPAVSSFSHGDSVAVTGSGFGSHAFDIHFIGGAGGRIESTSVGGTPTSGAGWTFNTSTWPSANKTGYDDSTRGRVLLATWGAGTTNLSVDFDYGATIPANTRVYITNRVRTTDWSGPTTGVYQWKFIRFRGNRDVNDNPTDGDAYFASWPNDFGNSFVDFQGSSSGFEYISGENSTLFDGSSLPYHNQGWHRLEWLINHGGNANAICDSEIRISREGSFSHRLISILTNFTFNRNIRYIIFQNYLGNATFGSTSRIAQDDLYVQIGTFKRVELCDSATLSSAQWREIQLPTAWSDTSVTVSLNTGASRTGTVYLHVVGEDGASLGKREVTVS